MPAPVTRMRTPPFLLLVADAARRVARHARIRDEACLPGPPPLLVQLLALAVPLLLLPLRVLLLLPFLLLLLLLLLQLLLLLLLLQLLLLVVLA